MSLVIAYRDKTNGMYYIAGDSAVSIGNTGKNVLGSRIKKLFRAYNHPDILVGVVGDFRYCPLFANADLFDGYDQTFSEADEYRFMYNTVSPRLLKTINEDGRISAVKDCDSYNFGVLIVTKNGIYDIDRDFSVATYEDEYAVIGVGRITASAVLYVMDDYEEDVIKKITSAMQASIEYIDGINYPIHIFTEAFSHDYDKRKDLVLRNTTSTFIIDETK